MSSDAAEHLPTNKTAHSDVRSERCTIRFGLPSAYESPGQSVFSAAGAGLGLSVLAESLLSLTVLSSFLPLADAFELFLLSVMYQPLPLKWISGWLMRLRT